MILSLSLVESCKSETGETKRLGIVILGIARIEFLPARGKKKRRHASSASDLDYYATRKNSSTRRGNLSVRVCRRKIYGVVILKNAPGIVEN